MRMWVCRGKNGEVNGDSDFKSINRFIGHESKFDDRIEVTKEKNRMYLSTPHEISHLIIGKAGVQGGLLPDKHNCGPFWCPY